MGKKDGTTETGIQGVIGRWRETLQMDKDSLEKYRAKVNTASLQADKDAIKQLMEQAAKYDG